MGVLFQVIWWSSIATMYALLAMGNVIAATPFMAMSLLCTGVCVGWKLAEKRRGGDGE